MSGAVIVLIHGAWAGPWVWDSIIDRLSTAGHRPYAVALPGVGNAIDPDVPITLEMLTDSVIADIAGFDGPLVIVGHSGGGVVATQVAERLHDHVAGVVFVAGMMLPSGRSFDDICADVELPSTVGITADLEFTAEGRISTVPVDVGSTVFFQRADPAAAADASRRLRPQQESARLITPTWTTTRYGSIPKLYIEALDDRSVPLSAQRRMQEISHGVEIFSLDSDHAPQLSATDELATVIANYSNRLCSVSLAP
ncbi:esterase [Rhodococcus sp. 06-235-1A]|uniref:alpha/beta fold hydrolase n=1 Tax=Rhodococcus sp. 06-235-1A TaxID=2022508 RepID=UPI000B9B8287|nr:alpha/beta fold hydrolase [Rhodococcus sp. 06-235-1A]OZD06550.1 esterase [Rhodococcus sp. 06-235-1A]